MFCHQWTIFIWSINTSTLGYFMPNAFKVTDPTQQWNISLLAGDKWCNWFLGSSIQQLSPNACSPSLTSNHPFQDHAVLNIGIAQTSGADTYEHQSRWTWSNLVPSLYFCKPNYMSLSHLNVFKFELFCWYWWGGDHSRVNVRQRIVFFW